MSQEALPPAKKLTARRKKFIEMAVKYTNLTKAAIEAGFSERSAKTIARDLWAIPEIRLEIEWRRKEAADEAKLDAIEILMNLAAIARATPQDFVTRDGKLELADADADPRLWRALMSKKPIKDPETGAIVDFELKLRDSIKAQALYMKHLGMLRDIVQLTTPIPIQIYMPDNGRNAGSAR